MDEQESKTVHPLEYEATLPKVRARPLPGQICLIAAVFVFFMAAFNWKFVQWNYIGIHTYNLICGLLTLASPIGITMSLMVLLHRGSRRITIIALILWVIDLFVVPAMAVQRAYA